MPSKITKLSTFDKEHSEWRTPIDIGAAAANVTYSNTIGGTAVDNVKAALDKIVTTPSLPVGGTTGQILAKHSNSDGDAEWITANDVKNVTVSATASTGTFGDMTYTHTQVVSWTGMTANDLVDWYITSGTFDDEIGIASQSGQCTIYFGADPSTLTTLKLIASHLSV